MINYKKDLTGARFGKLLVIKGLDEYTINNGCKGYRKWKCACDCGITIITNSYQLLRGLTSSCGIKGRYNHTQSLKGKRFGKLLVIDRVKKDGSLKQERVWLCKCDCGKFREVRTYKLQKGVVKNCGCELSYKYKDRTLPVRKYLFKSYKNRAYSKGITFDLSFECFSKLISEVCFYCGCHPQNNLHQKNGAFCVYNGIDRKDNLTGYTEDNSVPCCRMCNEAKGAGTVEEFVEWGIRFYRYQKNYENQ